MRKIIVLSMITLDGVLQAPGGPKEDTAGRFKYGGWVAPYGDEVYGQVVAEEMKPSDILLGRKTFQIWADYWPTREHGWPGINDVTKYVFSKTLKKSDWKNSVFLKNVADIRKLKNTNGSNIQVWGSGQLVQLLLKNDLVDELWLKIHPLTLGKGKRLFDGGAIPAAFTLMKSTVTPSGVVIVYYKRSGDVKTGTIGGVETESQEWFGREMNCEPGFFRQDNEVRIKDDNKISSGCVPMSKVTGIGLFIGNMMITNQGGEIEVESTLDEGATFKIYLRRQALRQAVIDWQY